MMPMRTPRSMVEVSCPTAGRAEELMVSTTTAIAEPTVLPVAGRPVVIAAAPRNKTGQRAHPRSTHQVTARTRASAQPPPPLFFFKDRRPTYPTAFSTPDLLPI